VKPEKEKNQPTIKRKGERRREVLSQRNQEGTLDHGHDRLPAKTPGKGKKRSHCPWARGGGTARKTGGRRPVMPCVASGVGAGERKNQESKGGRPDVDSAPPSPASRPRREKKPPALHPLPRHQAREEKGFDRKGLRRTLRRRPEERAWPRFSGAFPGRVALTGKA